MELRAPSFALLIESRRSVDAEGWVRVQAMVTAGAFSGSFEASLQLEDLQRFKQELGDMDAAVGQPREAALKCWEPGISLSLQSTSLGAIRGTYLFTSEEAPQVELSGSFDMDQSYIPALSAGTQALIDELAGNSIS